ncbi:MULTISPECIES: DUF6057 family protein [Parabacteroides]|uniref:DUF6057 family protein n=3 Tax=Parabacteroides leei TaxID=2939491 RepID=UPI001897D8D5|nr:DUF6057 family protein [Parabacteroides goldsteinii]
MKLKVAVFWLVILVALFVFLQTYSKYHFYFIEQTHLFQFTGEYISGKLIIPGGFALVLSEFLVQFFILPYAGAAIIAGLLLITGLGVRGIVHRIIPDTTLFLLYLIPVVLIMFIHFDFNYLVAGTVALDIMLLALYFCLRISNDKWRIVVEVLLSPVLYGAIGSAAFLFSILVVIYELFNKTPKWYWVLLSGVLVVFCGICSVYFAALGEYRFAFLPDAYYHTALEPKSVIYYSWISLPLILILSFWLKHKQKRVSKKFLIAGCGVQVLLLFLLCWWGVPEYGDKKSIKVKELDYYARTEQWDKIIEESKGPLTNYLNLCYLNLALAHKGELADRAFSFDQKGPLGLMVGWNKTEQISILLSEVNFAMGNSALAQEMAFEAFATTIGEGNPRMLKRLVQTNLIYGEYPVAEKYIKVLENTGCYSSWASGQRKFLYNDAEVEKDTALGSMRKSLPKDNYLSELNNMEKDLRVIAETNPSNRNAIEYLGLFYLMSKDMAGFKGMVEHYYGTDVLPVLPKSFQEAVITLSEAEPDYWKRFNISPSVVQRFVEYKKQVLANRSNANVLPGLMRRAYGDTYWFYFMFK